ncbi:unnamed protein product [Meloidogyne enterolobii]|uniref:Uncharacterized protein n=1 Tax=Meloidogyne enterolobii TaxID=390850 RepID=A0ACB0ZA09_MELEN
MIQSNTVRRLHAIEITLFISVKFFYNKGCLLNLHKLFQISREETYVREQNLKEGRAEESARHLPGQTKPTTDFAKKAVVQPMAEAKVKIGEQTKTIQAPSKEEIEEKKRKEEERKRKIKEEEEEKKRKEEERKKKIKEEEERKRKKLKEEEEKRKKLEEEAKALAKKKATEEMKKKTAEEVAKVNNKIVDRLCWVLGILKIFQIY